MGVQHFCLMTIDRKFTKKIIYYIRLSVPTISIPFQSRSIDLKINADSCWDWAQLTLAGADCVSVTVWGPLIGLIDHTIEKCRRSAQ